MTETIKVIIPAYNEAKSIGKVIKALPSFVNEIIVVDNCSTDETAINAQKLEATVLKEIKSGYGNACLKGVNYINEQKTRTDIVVFIDGDYSDYPEELTKIIAPIIEKDIDFVIGARVKNLRAKGSMQPQQIFGNWLATFLMRVFFQITLHRSRSV